MAPAMGRLLASFLVQFPKVDIVQHVTNRYVDLVEEGFDVGLRGHSGPLNDSSMIQRQLARTPWHLLPGEDYLKRAGEPEQLEDLASHPGAIYSREEYGNVSGGK